MSAAQIFLEHQSLLQRIAFGMVGCIKDAEDLVQDTFEKWLQVDHQQIKNAKAYLIRILKNACINFLNSFRKTKEIQFDPLLELFKNKYEEIDFQLFDFENDLSSGVSLLLQKLTFPEFSLLLLKEGFEFDYVELSVLFEKKLDHCRQLLSRAKKKRSKRQLNFSLNQERRNQLTKEIAAIYKQGSLMDLITYLQGEIEK